MRSRRRGHRSWCTLSLVATLAGSPPAIFSAVTLFSANGPNGRPIAAVTVTYLANEGVLIASGGEQILIDALFGDGIDGYSRVAPARRAELEGAIGDFSKVDLVLATHAHADHFDAAAVARFLAANADARFVSTPEAVAAVRARPGGDALGERARAALPAEGASETLVLHGVTVTVFQFHHGREMRRPTANLGFLVEIGGRRILHLGDTEATADELAASGLAAREIDLALVPYWRLLGADGRAGVRRALAADRLALFHLPAVDAPADWWGVEGGLDGLRRIVTAELPDAAILSEPGTTLELAPASIRTSSP